MHLLSTSASNAQQYPAWSYPLSNTAQALYGALRSAGEVVRDHRGYHRGVTVVTYFCPVDSVAMAVGVTRQTVYNHLPALVDAGLIDQIGHYCTLNGRTKRDGSLWAVRLNPDESSSPVKVEHDYLKKSYRDLGEDIRQGRTAWAALQSYSKTTKPGIDLKPILSFAISPLEKSINNDCKNSTRHDLETLLDVAYADDEARNEQVDLAARAVANELGASSSSLNFYRWLTWQLVRLEKSGRGDYFYQVFLMAQRAGVDHREGACRNAGGLFVSRLKATGIWDDLRNAPYSRVGIRPMLA